MITTMGKAFLTVTVSILVVGVRADENTGLRFSSTPHMSTMKQGLSTEFGNMDQKLTALYKHVQSLNNKVSLHEETLAKFSDFESKYAELFTCLSVKEGKNVVLKEGCDLLLKKGNHKVEGELHVMGSHKIDGDVIVSNGNIFLRGGEHSSNGKGNLIVGESPNHKSHGSHNVILGNGHDITSYGSIVSGSNHTVSGPHASVISGLENKAISTYASITGGTLNTARGEYSSVSGSYGSMAIGKYSSVSGGYKSTASGWFSTVSGGLGNKASGSWSFVSGGVYNTAKGSRSFVSGGQRNIANADHTSVVDGVEVSTMKTDVGELKSISDATGDCLTVSNKTVNIGCDLTISGGNLRVEAGLGN